MSVTAKQLKRRVKGGKARARQTILISIMSVLCLLWLIPLVYMLSAAFTSDKVLTQTTDFKFFPPEWTFESFKQVFVGTFSESNPILRWFLNSLLVSSVTTVLVVILSAMAAYGYSRMKFRGRKIAFTFLMFTMMIPGVINMIPSYQIISTFGLKDTYFALILPSLGGVGNIFLIRQFLRGVPPEYDEAAKIDGAGDIQIFFRILLPQLVPVLVVVGLFTFIGSWNDLLWPQLVMTDTSMLTLTAGLGKMGFDRSNYPATSVAAAVVSIVPVFILYICAQKFLLQGISMSSGVKG